MFLNSSKCQITGRNIDGHKLANLHLGELKFSDVEGQPATVILGSPLGPTHYVQDHVSNQQQRLKIFLDRLAELHDHQVALFLMRHSLGVARITHLLRTVDPTLIELQLVSMESSLLTALTQIVGAPLTASAWEQAGLAINLGGLGISHPTRVAAAAYVASSLSFLSKTSTLCLPSPAGAVTEMLVNAIRVLNQQTSGTVHVTRDWMKSPLRAPEHLESHHFSQHWWSSIVSFHSRNRLVSSVSARDRLRLQHQLDPCSGGWLTPIPSVSLGLSFAPPEFQALLRWWLGLPQRQSPRESDTCPRCGDSMDPFGDDAVCCKLNNFYVRHNMVADAVSRVLAGVGVHTDREVMVAGKERPADLLAHGMSSSTHVALDITVVHTLSHFDTGRNNSRVSDAEKEKHEHYDAVRTSAGLSFKAFGLSTFLVVPGQMRTKS